jgi:hypothetical protein
MNLDSLTSLLSELENLVRCHERLLEAVVAESKTMAAAGGWSSPQSASTRSSTAAADDPNGNESSRLSRSNGELNEAAAQGQRIGRVFLSSAAELKSAHTSYSKAHPRAVSVIDKLR